MANNQSPELLAGGNILPSTFVKMDTTNLASAAQGKIGVQAGANDKIIGISMEGTDQPARSDVSGTQYAAISGESFKLYGLGDVCLLKAGSGGWTSGDYLECDSSGNGVTVASTGSSRNVGAVALTNANASEFGLVQIVILQIIPTGGGFTIADGGNIVVGATNGTQIATNSSQKLGFFGATAITQVSGTGELVGMNGNGATNANAVNMNANGNLGSTLYGLNDIVKGLKRLGLFAQ